MSQVTMEQVVRAISANAIQTPRMAREDILAESRMLELAFQRDKAKFVARMMDQSIVDGYGERISLYDKAAAVYYATLFEKTDARIQWEANEKTFNNLKWETIEEMRFAARKFPTVLAYIDKIAEGKGFRDTVCDFSDIPELINNYRGVLEENGFDFALETACIQTRGIISKLLSKAEMSPVLIEEHKIFMYQAYTYLNEATAEIREFGQHIFRKDPEKLDDYKSEYYQNKGSLRTNNTSPESFLE